MSRPWTLGAAAAVAALLTWVLQALAGRLLGPTQYAAFMIVWGLTFVEVGLLLGLQQEVTRSVASTAADPAHRRLRDARPWMTGVVVGLAGACLLFAVSPAWAPAVAGSAWPVLACATSIAFLFYAVNNAVNGGLAARQRWADLSSSLVLESVIRLILVLLALAAGVGLAGQAWGLAAAGATWLLLLVRPGFRSAARERGDAALPISCRQAAVAMVATGCSAILVSGFPVLLRVTSKDGLTAHEGVVIAAVVATRAPLLVPLNVVQAVLLTRFVTAPERRDRTLALTFAVIGAVGLIGAALATLVGPWLLRAIYGPDFVISGGVLGVLVIAAAVMAAQAVSGMAVLALGRHVFFTGAWMVATLVAVVCLSLDASVDARCCVALALGPLVGLAVNLAVVRAEGPPRRTPAPDQLTTGT